jgi:glutamine amidotransferase
MSSTIAVVDYGMGNLRSVSKALEHVACEGQRVIVTSDASVIDDAERIVFPGQGAARDCMKHLKEMKLEEVVLRAAHEKPFLGICMGMQVLMAHSEENQGIKCMGLYAGNVRAFSDEALASQMQSLKIPHMGWNKVSQKQAHPLWQDIQDDSRFYFVHSYYAELGSQTTAQCDYIVPFSAALQKDNFHAVQFHPEKSADVGQQLIKNFLEL